MLGFGSLGEFPLADVTTGPPPVVIVLPGIELSLEIGPISLLAGKNINLAATSIAFQSPPLIVGAGKSLELPPLALTSDYTTLEMQGGRNVDLPSVDSLLNIFTPTAYFGKNINLAAVPINVAVPKVGTSFGKHFDLPRTLINGSIPPIKVLPGKIFSLPKLSISSTYGPVIARTGRIFNLANEFSRGFDVGNIAEGALGEFALGEGTTATVNYSVPIHLQMTYGPLKIFPGKNIPLHQVPITVDIPVPEIHARRRKLRTTAISS